MTENLLRGGDYVPDGFGGFVRLQEEEALLERALFKLTCRRGAFPFLPELGSRLRELGRLRPSARNAAARQYAAQALEGMPTRTQKVIEAMGGIDAFMPPDKKYFEMERFEQTYETMLRKNPIGLPGSTAGQRQITE